jgi:hypothetical protein
MNPRNQKQKVAEGVISGIGGVDKFHGSTFPETWFKIDVKEALLSNAPLLYPHSEGDQNIVKDAVGGNVLWDSRLLRKA